MSLTMEVEKEYKSIRHIWYISVKIHVFAWLVMESLSEANINKLK